MKRDIPMLCEHFLSFYAPSFNQTSEEFRRRLAVVHYEKLVSDPKQMLAEVAGFTGIPFDEIDPADPLDTGHVKLKDTSSIPMYSPWVTDVTGRNLSASRVGNFRKVLTPTEIATVEDRCGQFFEWFDYSRNAA
ncbi:MAG: sulfotransferase domain-containing protein [Planctomycetaceae bacterium]